MKYHDALRYLYGLVDYEKRRIERYTPEEFRLDRVVTLLEKLGNPHHRYPKIHIAGTKGKGSVAAMLAAVAQAGGQRVGLYTSPHLHTYRERMQINRAPISRERMAALVAEIQPVVESILKLTIFEVNTALAFRYFAQEEVDLAVIEVGLGGRLDATNVITPLVSVITSLSLDHTYLLGDTLDEIAGEKAGIIKPGVPVISAPQRRESWRVLAEVARKRHAPFTLVGRDWQWEARTRSLAVQTISVTRETGGPSELAGGYQLALLGDFQQENATTAIATLATLREQGHTWITRTAVQKGLAQVTWPGRMEVLNRHPPLIIDCAHNPYSARTLAKSLQKWFPETRWILIYGASNDKDITGMLRALLPISEHVIVTRSYHPRAASPYALADQCVDLGQGAEIAINPERALEQVQPYLKPGLGILATGSIFLVADIQTTWAKENPLTLPRADWDNGEAWQS
ncbi:MAG: folylpolyglutamate synthase/dihydrofolate synthase family protein [Chloroflexota bacterium]|nr:folylpolyglutamate synthase/dihydrofolate synthase family protein [Chloroflexota bacterium]